MESEKPENVQKRENVLRPDVIEERSLSQVGYTFLEGAAGGAGIAAGKHLVDESVGKIKDVLAPKDEGPKIELPPGVDK